MYYVWLHEIPEGTGNMLSAGLPSDNPWFKFTSKYFFRKNPVPQETPPLPINYETSDSPTLPVLDYIAAVTFKYQIISEKLYSILNSYAIPYMEFLPATLLIRKTGKIHKNLYSFNIYKKFYFANLEASEYTADEDDIIREYTKLVLHENDIPSDLKFFRLEHTVGDFIIHEDIRNACVDQGITGIRFIPVEEWNERNRYKY